ncbi:hypothetical protein ACJMK2_035603 [Sinanodonta woodiana]|uniref:CCHC-type domain-containing protein n=1 Tax=Sinanodonta woodiana TaxID=1069815 RepID=A0ABD3WW26_SINWO
MFRRMFSTVKVDGKLNREQALRRLHAAGVTKSDIQGLYREGENTPWNALLYHQAKPSTIHRDGLKYLARLRVELHIHWLPLYINDKLIADILLEYGEILVISRDKTILLESVNVENGTRVVTLETTDMECRRIPHIVSLGPCGFLITMKGRPPLCLKCRDSGHLRKDCPKREPPQSTSRGTSYASVTAGVLFDIDTLEWTTVRNPKRIRKMKTVKKEQEDNLMDTSFIQD